MLSSCLRLLQITNSYIGLDSFKRNLISDIRYNIFENERPKLRDEAYRLAIRLGFALTPMLVRHDDILGIHGANLGQAPEVWERWRSVMYQMFAEGLELKANLEVDSRPFKVEWPILNDDFNKKNMIVDVDSGADINAQGKVYVALLPIITQNDIVISKALVILQC